METKICSKCKIEKKTCDFDKDKHMKTGLQSQCKLCKKEYRDKINPEIKKEKLKEWRLKNEDKVKTYYNKLYQQKYHEENREHRLENISNYNKINRETLLKKKKEYAKNNKENRNKQLYNRRQTDSIYNLTITIRTSINKSFKNYGYNKTSKTQEILGCSFEEFKIYLESKFEPWMTWDNKGNPKDGIFEPNKTWDIDHIISLSTAQTEEDIIRLNHYTNLQPLCSYYNRVIKRNN